MDTDSLYFALSYDYLVRPELRDTCQICKKIMLLLGQMKCARTWAVQAGVRGHLHDCSV